MCVKFGCKSASGYGHLDKTTQGVIFKWTPFKHFFQSCYKAVTLESVAVQAISFAHYLLITQPTLHDANSSRKHKQFNLTYKVSSLR